MNQFCLIHQVYKFKLTKNPNLDRCGGGGDQVVSIRAFYPNTLTSNPKGKRGRSWPILKKLKISVSLDAAAV